MTKKGFSLGRGLDALIDTETIATDGSSSISEVELSLIYPNPNQPRKNFDEEALNELAASIKELGVISPITLHKNSDGTYLIIAGERRYRAAKIAGLSSIPAYIRTAADEQIMEMALIENIQREDLDAIEIALAYQKLIDEYHLTQERMSERVGKKRATIANYIRLLRLPAEIQLGVKEKKIEMGHARAILAIDDTATQIKVYKKIIQENLSVRKVEQLIKAMQEENPGADSTRIQSLPEYKQIQDNLAKLFGTKVQFTCNDKGKGKISVPFKNDKELAQIMQLLDQINR